MADYMSCLDEKNYYSDYVGCIKENINSSDEDYVFFIKTVEGTIGITTDLFYKIYGYPVLINYLPEEQLRKYPESLIGNYVDLPLGSRLEVLLERKNQGYVKSYIADTDELKWKNLYFDPKYAKEIPDSILVINPKDPTDRKEIAEARVLHYIGRDENLALLREMSSHKSRYSYYIDRYYVPYAFLLVPMLENRKDFVDIVHMRGPYTQNKPYEFYVYEQYDRDEIDGIKVTKKPEWYFNHNLDFLLILDPKDYIPMNLYLLGLDNNFKPREENINNIQIKYDELEHKFHELLEKIVTKISKLKFVPAGLDSIRILVDGNGEPIFDGIYRGAFVSTNTIELEEITIESLRSILHSLVYSPFDKYCKREGAYVICDREIKGDGSIGNVAAPIYYTLLSYDRHKYKYNDEERKYLLKNTIINNKRLEDIIGQHKDDEFAKIKETVVKAVNKYLISFYGTL
jgi:hypothetical protein